MNPQLTTRLRHLRLSGMVEALPGRVAQAEAAPLPHLEFLELLVEDELARRADRLFVRRLKQAGITVMKTLADFDWTFNAKIPKGKLVELASARFVASQSGVLLIGPPGVGKSHVATALAIGAIRAGRRALVRSTFDLAADFAQAEATGARRDLVQQLTRVDLLVLEDFGMKKLGPTAAEDLLEIFVRRHEAASTLITTNRPTQDWGVFLGDVPAATAILDRFLAHATIVQMTGKDARATSTGAPRRSGCSTWRLPTPSSTVTSTWQTSFSPMAQISTPTGTPMSRQASCTIWSSCRIATSRCNSSSTAAST
jgi:DNA replication protein DnaC